MSDEQIPTETQLRNDCENLWQELNNVSRLSPGDISNLSFVYACYLYGHLWERWWPSG